eukprot:7386997-Prymnesium_polylepis.1
MSRHKWGPRTRRNSIERRRAHELDADEMPRLGFRLPGGVRPSPATWWTYTLQEVRVQRAGRVVVREECGKCLSEKSSSNTTNVSRSCRVPLAGSCWGAFARLASRLKVASKFPDSEFPNFQSSA